MEEEVVDGILCKYFFQNDPTTKDVVIGITNDGKIYCIQHMITGDIYYGVLEKEIFNETFPISGHEDELKEWLNVYAPNYIDDYYN